MNPTILQNPFPLEYPDNDFLNPSRDFSHAPNLPTGDLVQYSTKNGPASHALAQPLAVSVNNSSRYGTQLSSVQDAPLFSRFQQPSNVLLSPPDSCAGSVSASTNSGLSSIAYSALPALASSHATSTDSYTNVPPSYLPNLWTEKMMAEQKYRPHPLPPPSLSPPPPHGVTYTLPPSFPGPGRTLTEPYPTGYHINRPVSNGFPIPHDSSRYDIAGPPHRVQIEPWPPTLSPNVGIYVQQPPMTFNEPRQPQPRSDGPPFEDTKVLHAVFSVRSQQQLFPNIDASIQKGFFQVDHKWTCYRRNYFAVSCSFSFRPSSTDSQFYLQQNGHPPEPITKFAVSISARTAAMNSNQDSESRALVQHTPKRDKATESVPGKVIIQPGPPKSLSGSAAISASTGMFHSPQPSSMSGSYVSSYGAAQQQTPPASHVFERIQFQKATANNGKRRAQQQYFHIIVELSAEYGRGGDSQWVKIATTQSHPIVVRGRSPGHYKDNVRRDSTTSMDPDRGVGGGGAGAGAGGSGGGYGSLSGICGTSRVNDASMVWDSSNRSSGYSTNNYRRMAAMDRSPVVDDTVDSSPESSNEMECDESLGHPLGPGENSHYHTRSLRNHDVNERTKNKVSGHQAGNYDAHPFHPRICYSATSLDFGFCTPSPLETFVMSPQHTICSS